MSQPLLALPYHDGLALIAAERRALHAVRQIIERLLEVAIRSGWPATTSDQRGQLQLDGRRQLIALRELGITEQFRGLELLSGVCAMVGIQAAPGSDELLVLGLAPCGVEALGLGSLDVGTLAGARLAREQLRAALALLTQAEAVVVSDLHELLAATRLSAPHPQRATGSRSSAPANT
jgi:hypothetical protein